MPPPTVLPLRSPQRQSRAEHVSKLTDTSPTFEALRSHQNDHCQAEARVASKSQSIRRSAKFTSPSPAGRRSGNAKDDDIRSTSAQERPPYQKMARGALLNDRTFVPPKPMAGLGLTNNLDIESDVHRSAHGSHYAPLADNQKRAPPSPRRIDAFTGMEDVVQRICMPSPRRESLRESTGAIHGRHPAYLETHSKAYRQRLPGLQRSELKEPLNLGLDPEYDHEAFPSGRRLPTRTQFMPVTPAPQRQTYQSIATPYRPISSPFFRSPGTCRQPRFPPTPVSKYNGFQDNAQGIRMELSNQPSAAACCRTPTINRQNAYGDPFYRGSRTNITASERLLRPESIRTVDGLFQHPDLSQSIARQPMTASDRTYQSMAQCPVTTRAALLPSATPSTASLSTLQFSRGSRNRDALGIKGARSGNLRMQSTRPAMHRQLNHYEGSSGLHSSVGITRSVRR